MDNNKSDQRSRTLIGGDVQKAIMWRVASYWFFSVFFIFLPLALYQTVQQPEVNFAAHLVALIKLHWPVMAMLFVLLPFVMNDISKLTNKFVGPLYRVRRNLKAFEESGQLAAVNFREGDYWQDMAENLNSVTNRLAELESMVEDELRETNIS